MPFQSLSRWQSLPPCANAQDHRRPITETASRVCIAFAAACPAASGHLVVTPGNEMDFDEIGGDVRRLCSPFNVVSAGYDPWQSSQMSQRLRAEGVPMHEFRATTQNFSPAAIELDAVMRAGRLRHDGNPVLMWCLGNVGAQGR